MSGVSVRCHGLVFSFLHYSWVDQGDDEVEVLVVEVWVNEFPIRIINGYGPQLSDSIERKRKFWNF